MPDDPTDTDESSQGSDDAHPATEALRGLADVVGLGGVVDDATETVDAVTDRILDSDPDDDGLRTGDELGQFGTNPLAADTDGDHASDGREVARGRDPRSASGEEVTDALKGVADKVGLGGVVDGAADAIRRTLDGDPDDDGYGNLEEVAVHQTSPVHDDTDGDGLTDDLEIEVLGTNPRDRSDPFPVEDPPKPTAKTPGRSRPADGPLAEGDQSPTSFLCLAGAQVGVRFRIGAEARVGDADPDAFDSSELVQWAANRTGARMPDGSWNQYKAMHRAGAVTAVDDALSTPGALVFRFSTDPFETSGRPNVSHVAISLGDGRVIEATDAGDGGVQIRDAGDRFTHAAVIPEFADESGGASTRRSWPTSPDRPQTRPWARTTQRTRNPVPTSIPTPTPTPTVRTSPRPSG